MGKFKEKINDDRLTIDMKRTRNGKTQLFRRDYKDRQFTDEENADVVLIHELPEVYAELIDEEWYWVKGCSKCDDSMNYGDSYSYQVCYEHNRCIDCGTHREDLTSTPWGHRDGFICKPCMDILNAKTREDAFAKIDDIDDLNTQYNDEIICPHCGSNLGNDDIYQDQDMTCEVCKGDLKITINHTIDYSTEIVGDRVTK